jgi:hypothetical protein
MKGLKIQLQNKGGYEMISFICGGIHFVGFLDDPIAGPKSAVMRKCDLRDC